MFSAMVYHQSEELAFTVGKFVTYGYGYYSFELENEELLVFEEINKELLQKYDLRIGEHEGKFFEVSYSILTEDLDDEDYVVLRLNNLTIVSKEESSAHENIIKV